MRTGPNCLWQDDSESKVCHIQISKMSIIMGHQNRALCLEGRWQIVIRIFQRLNLFSSVLANVCLQQVYNKPLGWSCELHFLPVCEEIFAAGVTHDLLNCSKMATVKTCQNCKLHLSWWVIQVATCSPKRKLMQKKVWTNLLQLFRRIESALQSLHMTSVQSKLKPFQKDLKDKKNCFIELQTRKGRYQEANFTSTCRGS